MIITLLFFTATVYGHGRLLRPKTRVGHDNYENDPTGSSGNGGNNNDAWVCRHDAPNPSVDPTPVTAGEVLNLQWHFGAKHVGDCDAYISYDVDKSRSEMEWFKIGNFFDCRVNSDREVNHPLLMPSMLQNGAAVLRWGWYALHQHPNVEFYSQCADIVISGGQTTLSSQVKKYKLIGNNPIFPLRNGQGVGYANRFPPVEEWMTGPPCAYGIADDVNECYRTAKGTQGYIDIGQTDNVPAETSSTSTTSTSEKPFAVSTTRCGCNWVDADSKCGMPCETDADCSSTSESCYKDLRTCEEIGVSYSCSTWKERADRPNIPDGWCQTTCTNAATRHYCDSDACECVEVNLGDSIFSLNGVSNVMALFGLVMAMILI